MIVHLPDISFPSLSAKYFIKRLSIADTQAFIFSPYRQKSGQLQNPVEMLKKYASVKNFLGA